MAKIIQLSDLHLCPEGERVVGFDPAKRLDTVLDAIRREHADAELCLVSGDLTDRGDEASYLRLRDRLAGFPLPVCLMLGNHDRRDAFRRVFPSAHDDGGGFVQAAIELGGQRVVFLDTLDEVFPSAGRLCASRLSWLEATLAAAPETPTLLALHHPAFDLGMEYFRSMLLADGEALEALLDRHPQVVHLAFGHVHVPVFGRRRGRSFSAARGTCHPMLPPFVGMATDYVDRPPSYELILFEGETVIVHHIQIQPDEEPVAREVADLDGGPGTLSIFRNA